MSTSPRTPHDHDLSAPSERVLATLNPDGSRHWINPRLSKGRFLEARRIVAYALILIFAALPYITINGKPAVLLDVAERRFTLFGATFFPTDTVLLAVLFLMIFLGIFLITALFGRVWCGWACPQTVYMEFLYRPIERLIEGAPGSSRSKQPAGPARKTLKYTLFFIASCYLAHTFLAYFVGVERLLQWVQRSPVEHPSSFIIMAATTALMMFDFCFFREQTCLVACPYGRLQAAMIDRNSLIISYDQKRGEPRGKLVRRPQSAPADVALPILAASGAEPAPPATTATGDCIDCKMCVTTCPTGIDIRDGLQMECIGCAQCIDACDAVMDKIGRPRGLVRYSSAEILEGRASTILRPRIFLYPVILAGLLGLFVYMLVTKPDAEAAVLPRQGAPFYTLPAGDIANQVRIRLVNRGEKPARFDVGVTPPDQARGLRIVLDIHPILVAPGESVTVGFVLSAPKEEFSARGVLDASIIVTSDLGFTRELPYRLLGPVNRGAASSGTP